MKQLARSTVGYVQITRPHFIPFLLPLLLFEYYLIRGRAATVSDFGGPLLAFILLGSGLNVMNDWGDVTADSMNHPNRPIPSGRVSPNGAIVYAFLLAGSGLTLLHSWGRNATTVALITVILGFSDQGFLRGRYRTPGLVTLVSSTISGLMALVFWAAYAPITSVAYLVVLSGILVNFAAKNVNDIRDLEGDRKSHYRSIPAVFGSRAGAWAALLSFLAGWLCGGLVCWTAGLPLLSSIVGGLMGCPLAVLLLYLVKSPTLTLARGIFWAFSLYVAVTPGIIYLLALHAASSVS